jgi:hypothetical protein
MTKLMAYVAFGGGREPDPDSPAEELRRAGYDVFRMPDRHPILAHPLDDHIECLIEGSDDSKIIDAIMGEIDGIVDQHGMCIECGPIAADYVPFKQLFADCSPLENEPIPGPNEGDFAETIGGAA